MKARPAQKEDRSLTKNHRTERLEQALRYWEDSALVKYLSYSLAREFRDHEVARDYLEGAQEG